ncbi:MAG: hypothetical protein GF381_01765 [Candidatus Pacebacteria bacterium]|nr:hypothetical protein [Candidatus Paceibacterota bacterium]
MADQDQEKKLDQYKVGDKVVRFGRVYEIYKKTEETVYSDGKELDDKQEVIYFKPVYENIANRSLICSIPVSNIEETNMRRPMSESEVDELLAFIKKPYVMKSRFNTRMAKETLKSNDPDKIALILKKLAIVKHDPDTNFTYTKKRIFRRAMQRLQEEVALVKEMELEEAQEMLEKMLDKQGKKGVELLPED